MVGLGNIFIGLIFLLASIPLLKRRISRNPLFGFRFRQALASDENWYRINEYGARRMMRWAIVMIVLGIAAVFAPLLPTRDAIRVVLLVLSLTPLLMLVPIVECYLYARQFDKE